MTAICEVCYKEIPSEVYFDKQGAWLSKTCSDHGNKLVLLDTDLEFYKSLISNMEPDPRWLEYINSTSLDVTDRCNAECQHCYALPDNTIPDKSIDSIIDLSSKIIKGKHIQLMGAEPTMRNDLSNLCKDLHDHTGKCIGIFTNGIRLADTKYLGRIIDTVGYFCVSLHTRNYLSNPKLYDMKLQGINNLISLKKYINNISFSLPTLNELEEAIDTAFLFKGKADYFRIRTPCSVGLCGTPEVYLSDLVKKFKSIMLKKGYKVREYKSDNNPYHVNYIVNKVVFRLIHLPSVHSFQFNLLQTPPYGLFVPELGETNLLHHVIMQAALKQGKWSK